MLVNYAIYRLPDGTEVNAVQLSGVSLLDDGSVEPMSEWWLTGSNIGYRIPADGRFYRIEEGEYMLTDLQLDDLQFVRECDPDDEE